MHMDYLYALIEGLNRAEQRIFAIMIRESLAPADMAGREPEPVALTPAWVALACKLDRPRACRALTGMVKAGILIRDDRGYRVQEDLSLWTGPDGTSPRFDAEALAAFAGRSGPVRLAEPALSDRDNGPLSDPDNALSHSDNAHCHDRTTPVADSDNTPCHDPTTPVVRIGNDPAAAYKDSRASEDSIQIQSRLNPDQSIMTDRGMQPGLVEGPDGKMHPIKGPANDPAEVDRIADLVEQKYFNTRFPNVVRDLATVYPIAWIEKAYVETLIYPEPLTTFKPVHNRLKSWQVSGGPPADPPPIASTNGTPPPPARRESPYQAEQRAKMERIVAHFRVAEPEE